WTLNDPSLFQEAEVTFYSPNRIVVKANLSTPGLLVLSELWYPGWRAYDNGQEVKSHRANYVLRSVYLEEGRHTIEFVYDPFSVKLGCRVSAGAVLGLAVYVVSVTWGRRD
ncbi:MAG: YfhO family protein, partial [Anaerolineae bacterium]